MHKKANIEIANVFANESALIQLIREGDKKAFEYFYTSITSFYMTFIACLHSAELSEEIIRNVFLNIWKS